VAQSRLLEPGPLDCLPDRRAQPGGKNPRLAADRNVLARAFALITARPGTSSRFGLGIPRRLGPIRRGWSGGGALSSLAVRALRLQVPTFDLRQALRRFSSSSSRPCSRNCAVGQHLALIQTRPCCLQESSPRTHSAVHQQPASQRGSVRFWQRARTARCRGCGQLIFALLAAPAGSLLHQSLLGWPDPFRPLFSRHDQGPLCSGGGAEQAKGWFLATKPRFASGRPAPTSPQRRWPDLCPPDPLRAMPLQVWTRLGGALVKATRTSSRPSRGRPPEPFRTAWPWWREGLGVLERPGWKGVSLPRSGSFQLQALGSPLAFRFQAGPVAPEPARRAAWPCGRPGAAHRAWRQPIGQTRSTVSPSAWKRRLPQHRGRTGPAAAGRLELGLSRWGEHPKFAAAAPWACSRPGGCRAFGPGRSAAASH